MNLPSCFSITGSDEHISSVNTIESGRSTASSRGGVQIWEYDGSKVMGLTVDQEVNFIVYLAGGAECTIRSSGSLENLQCLPVSMPKLCELSLNCARALRWRGFWTYSR